MKRRWPLFLSVFIAISIAINNKKTPSIVSIKKNPSWKTFVKNSKSEVTSHKSTPQEFEDARLPTIKREIASDKNSFNHESSAEMQDRIIRDNHLLVRDDRVLIGDIKKTNYQDSDTPLEMVNKINPNWKDILGLELLRFQADDTKLMIKEEFPIIQIQNGKGFYAEQVIITYVLNNGTVSSYRALIDSETGSITETWDKTIHEKYGTKKAGFRLPLENNSGIIVR